jgi:UrcA family protein
MQWDKTLSMAVAVALTGTGLLAAFPADAKPRSEKPVTIHGQRYDYDIPTRKVSYADLNLATLAGESTLNRRVGGAVRSVCAESVAGSDFYAELSCHRFAWGGARPQITRAVMRARQIASTGTSSIMPVTITLSVVPR